jgi:hypothetical protein
MTQQTGVNKTAALDELYDRIAQAAAAMGGTASRAVSSLSIPSTLVPTPGTEGAPTLHIKMPNGFEVELSPTHPLSIGTALSVQARRTIGGARKSDWMLSFGPNGWQRSQAPLSDREISACLTPEGPPTV